MTIILFIINILAATALLLFGIRQIRGGIERRFGGIFHALLTGHDSNVIAAFWGVILAMIIQSSAAVALLVSSFAAAEMVGFAAALAAVLGADLGSAILVQILSYDLSWLMPLLMAAGGWLYLKATTTGLRETGRILLGLALILLALQLLRMAVTPVQSASFLPAIATYLSTDFVTAFLVGMILAFIMQSGVAAILITVTTVQIGALPFVAALSMVLGANLGSVLIPFWLSRGAEPQVRRIPLANMVLRGGAAILILLVVNLFGLVDQVMLASPAQSLILCHLIFNAALIVLALPFIRRIERPMIALLPNEPSGEETDIFAMPLSALGDDAPSRVAIALSAVQQELLQMLALLERMFDVTYDVYDRNDPSGVAALREQDQTINSYLAQIRDYVVRLPRDRMNKSERRRARAFLEYAVRLESAGDVLSDRMARIATLKHDQNRRFSDQGWKEIVSLHRASRHSFALARHMVLTDDVETARHLVQEKAGIKAQERESRKSHVKRLERGGTSSFETSDLHLETLRALREFQGHIAAVAYPVLYKTGQIMDTRLKAADADHGKET